MLLGPVYTPSLKRNESAVLKPGHLHDTSLSSSVFFFGPGQRKNLHVVFWYQSCPAVQSPLQPPGLPGGVNWKQREAHGDLRGAQEGGEMTRNKFSTEGSKGHSLQVLGLQVSPFTASMSMQLSANSDLKDARASVRAPPEPTLE